MQALYWDAGALKVKRAESTEFCIDRQYKDRNTLQADIRTLVWYILCAGESSRKLYRFYIYHC